MGESSNKGMSVLFAKRISDGTQCVVKVRERSTSFKKDSDEVEWRSATEFQLNMPTSATLCQFYDVIATERNYYIVMEKVEGMDLFEQMVKEGLLASEAREIIYQTLEGLKSLHDMGRIHKDLKLENIMVDMNSPREPSSPGAKATLGDAASGSTASRSRSPSPGVKLIDFDTVQKWEPSSPKVTDVLGTDGYIAPEAYAGVYSPASDVYCIGVIMYRLLTRKSPYNIEIFDDKPGENYVGSVAMRRIQERMKNETIDFKRRPLDEMPEASDLLQKLLSYDPLQRPSAEEAMAHD